jgi:hypothetical protein
MEIDLLEPSEFEDTISSATTDELRERARVQEKIVMQREAAFYIEGIFGLPDSKASLAALGQARTKHVMLERALTERTKVSISVSPVSPLQFDERGTGELAVWNG